MSLRIPELPLSWPFPPRKDLAPLREMRDLDLGDLGGEWRLFLEGNDPISGPWEPISSAFGRGGVRRCGDAVLRPYRRGGLIRFLSRRSYASPRRFQREWEIHRALWVAGFPTVRPLGYGWRRRGLLFEGVYLTRWEEALPWPRDWARGESRQAELGLAIEALSGWGLFAPDLNATNVLLPEGGGVVLLDWDRAAFLSGQQLREAYRRRMARSLAKLGAPESIWKAWAG